jgi:hypothetical protein
MPATHCHIVLLCICREGEEDELEKPGILPVFWSILKESGRNDPVFLFNTNHKELFICTLKYEYIFYHLGY